MRRPYILLALFSLMGTRDVVAQPLTPDTVRASQPAPLLTSTGPRGERFAVRVLAGHLSDPWSVGLWPGQLPLDHGGENGETLAGRGANGPGRSSGVVFLRPSSCAIPGTAVRSS
jgi:hypothetical protein